MTPLDTVPWYGMGGYGMGYPTKYTTPFRPVVSGLLFETKYWRLRDLSNCSDDFLSNIVLGKGKCLYACIVIVINALCIRHSWERWKDMAKIVWYLIYLYCVWPVFPLFSLTKASSRRRVCANTYTLYLLYRFVYKAQANMQSNNNFGRNLVQPYAGPFSWQVPGLLTSTSVYTADDGWQFWGVGGAASVSRRPVIHRPICPTFSAFVYI